MKYFTVFKTFHKAKSAVMFIIQLIVTFVNNAHYTTNRLIIEPGNGKTITQYLRQLRMERAAELLRAGEFNVTEVALEVGYNSLSHFSAAFHEMFGCCPGLYPIKTPAQKV